MGHWTNRFWWDRTQRLNWALDKQVWVIQGLGGIEHRGGQTGLGGAAYKEVGCGIGI